MTVDWQEQWALYAQDFRDGCAHIDLNGPVLKLCPGEGFGDLSHPTTRLVWQLMAPRVANRQVVDIGCGSGILALGALLFGAKGAFGIDIDPGALEHARSNSRLNGLERKVLFTKELPKRTLKAPLILMNMIFSEQKEAWKSCALKEGELITSGILVTERQRYLEQAREWGWQLMEEQIEEEWLGCVFKL